MIEHVANSTARATCRWFRGVAALCLFSTSAVGAQAITGRVVGPGGVGLENVSIGVQPSGISVRSDTHGGFILGALPAGSYSLSAHRIGFHPITTQFRVPLAPTGLVVRLQPIPVVLDTLYTNGFAATLPRLYLRQEEHLGAMLYGPRVQDLFQRADGRSIVESLLLDRHFWLQFPPKPCGAWILVDDKPIDPQTPIDFYIEKKDIAAIEVFRDADFVHEPYIDAHRLDFNSGCRPVVLIWSKWYKSRPWAGH